MHQNPTSREGLAPLLSIVAPLDEARKATADVATLTQQASRVDEDLSEKGGTAEPFLYERTLGGRDVLVRVTHRTLARGDIQFIDNDWGDARYPLVPGHEIVGIVEEAGSEVADLHAGDRVGIGYQQEACFDCSFCQRGTEQLCASQKVIAVDRYGGLAERILVDARLAFRLPPLLDSVKPWCRLERGLLIVKWTLDNYPGVLETGTRCLTRRLSTMSSSRSETLLAEHWWSA